MLIGAQLCFNAAVFAFVVRFYCNSVFRIASARVLIGSSVSAGQKGIHWMNSVKIYAWFLFQDVEALGEFNYSFV